MTRINLIEPKHLTRRHLIAEGKEITQILFPMQRSLEKYEWGVFLKRIPKDYTLNAGHCLFFYDKLGYIFKRFISLYNEMRDRNVNVNEDLYNQRLNQIETAGQIRQYNDWTPSQKDYKIVVDRISQRINEKIHLYPDADLFFQNVDNYIGTNNEF